MIDGYGTRWYLECPSPRRRGTRDGRGRSGIGDLRRLVWEGIAVLAYDKRGVGESQGVYPRNWGNDAESTLGILAADAAAAFDRLRRESGVDPTRLGFFGASQAGWIIPLAAESLSPPPRFHVILSGAAVSTGVEELYSTLTGDGHRPPQIADASEIRDRVAAYTGPPGFEPAHLLRASRVPTLWLLGERDASVPTFASVRVLDSIRAAGNLSHTVIVYPEADHSLRDVTTGESAPLWADAFSWLQEIGVLHSAGGHAAEHGDPRGKETEAVRRPVRYRMARATPSGVRTPSTDPARE